MHEYTACVYHHTILASRKRDSNFLNWSRLFQHVSASTLHAFKSIPRHGIAAQCIRISVLLQATIVLEDPQAWPECV